MASLLAQFAISMVMSDGDVLGSAAGTLFGVPGQAMVSLSRGADPGDVLKSAVIQIATQVVMQGLQSAAVSGGTMANDGGERAVDRLSNKGAGGGAPVPALEDYHNGNPDFMAQNPRLSKIAEHPDFFKRAQQLNEMSGVSGPLAGVRETSASIELNLDTNTLELRNIQQGGTGSVGIRVNPSTSTRITAGIHTHPAQRFWLFRRLWKPSPVERNIFTGALTGDLAHSFLGFVVAGDGRITGYYGGAY